MRLRTLLAAALSTATLAATAGCSMFDEPADLQVYSARHYGSEEVFATFTEETGITVEFIDGDGPELIERMNVEGDESPADVFMTVDAGNLWNAADQGLLASLDSTVLDEAVPAVYRDSEDRWFGLVTRARTVIYNPDTVKESDLDPVDTYAGLADPKWKGRICMRDTSETYTSSLVASLIDLYGHDRTLQIVGGWVANDVEIMTNDILLIEAVEAGTCDVALVNHYYLAREMAERDVNAELYWASQQGAGTHVNVSGAGVVASSDNPTDAQTLLEWLATEGQDDMLVGNHEFPVNPDVSPDQYAAAFGSFVPMEVDAEAYGAGNAEALALLVQAGYQ